MITGTPPSSRNCFGRSPPSRVPLPAATTMATFIRLGLCVADPRPRGRCLYFSQGAACALAISCPFGLFGQPSEDHLASGGLQHACHGNVSVLTNQSPRVINHDHRAVIQIRHTLV